jgi:hypothetical protein
MVWSAESDIEAVQQWGYSRAEALEFVTRRAVFEARQVADQPSNGCDPELVERHLAYLDELREICLAAADEVPVA